MKAVLRPGGEPRALSGPPWLRSEPTEGGCSWSKKLPPSFVNFRLPIELFEPSPLTVGEVTRPFPVPRRTLGLASFLIGLVSRSIEIPHSATKPVRRASAISLLRAIEVRLDVEKKNASTSRRLESPWLECPWDVVMRSSLLARSRADLRINSTAATIRQRRTPPAAAPA